MPPRYALLLQLLWNIKISIYKLCDKSAQNISTLKIARWLPQFLVSEIKNLLKKENQWTNASFHIRTHVALFFSNVTFPNSFPFNWTFSSFFAAPENWKEGGTFRILIWPEKNSRRWAERLPSTMSWQWHNFSQFLKFLPDFLSHIYRQKLTLMKKLYKIGSKLFFRESILKLTFYLKFMWVKSN